MAIATMDDLIAGLIAGERLPLYKAAAAGLTALRWTSLWKNAGMPGAALTPSTGSGNAPGSGSPGAFPFSPAGVGDDQYLAQLAFTSNVSGLLMVVDRLVHSSGLSGTSVALQSVNTLPLTRYTDGVNVEIWLECYTQLGASTRTATVSYTNTAGANGRVGTGTIPATMHASEMVPVALQAGDLGVKSVESVTLSASTGTLGDFGVTLLKRLADVPQPGTVNGVEANCFDLGLPEVADNAALALMYFANSAAPGPWYGHMTLAKN